MMISTKSTLSTPLVDIILQENASALGEARDGYRNHIKRVLTYALHLLPADAGYREEMEVALAYHDLGVWTHGTLAYLEPSIDSCLNDPVVAELGLDRNLITNIIEYHHKFTSFRGPNADIVNAVRKGDWIDVTRGRMKKGVDESFILKTMQAHPDLGFRAALRTALKRNYQSRFTALRDVATIFRR